MQNYVVFKYFRDLVFYTTPHVVKNIMNLIITQYYIMIYWAISTLILHSFMIQLYANEKVVEKKIFKNLKTWVIKVLFLLAADLNFLKN